MKFLDFLSGSRVLEEAKSSFNGKVLVLKDFTWGVYFKSGGVTQSGGILHSVWKEVLTSLKKLLTKNKDLKIKNVLILGLGGGSVAKIIRSFWPKANLTGVDIDPVMVDLGKKYLGLEKTNLKIFIKDAFNFVKRKEKYDLICLDLYNGSSFPEKFKDLSFLKSVFNLLNKNGLAIFNRLYGTDERKEAFDFGKSLEKVFKKVDYMYPSANVMFICRR